jgi:hypothetical protein
MVAPRRLGKPTAAVPSKAIRTRIRVCFIGVFLCVFGSGCYICAVFGPAGHTNVFLSGKAEIEVETRQVFSLRSMRLQKLFACVSIRRIE